MSKRNMELFIPAVAIIFFLYLWISSDDVQKNEVKLVLVERSDKNPLITPDSSKSIGTNINGPSIIRVPSWIENRLGTYYMYFAHHIGQFIRLAYANTLEGPWTIYESGVLNLEDTFPFVNHIASPDVHVDNENKRILMYFHGIIDNVGQRTGIAQSRDGVTFNMSTNPEILGPPYFRVFKWNDFYYAIAKQGNASGILYRSREHDIPFEKGKHIIPRMRHAATFLRDDILFIFYSRIGDVPERILLSTMHLTDDWKKWEPSEPVDVIRPEKKYEGVEYPIQSSVSGVTELAVHQLRDPAIFEEDNVLYIFYSVAGESGISMAKTTLIGQNGLPVQ